MRCKVAASDAARWWKVVIGFVFFGSQKTIGYKDRLSELEGENKCL